MSDLSKTRSIQLNKDTLKWGTYNPNTGEFQPFAIENPQGEELLTNATSNPVPNTLAKRDTFGGSSFAEVSVYPTGSLNKNKLGSNYIYLGYEKNGLPLVGNTVVLKDNLNDNTIVIGQNFLNNLVNYVSMVNVNSTDDSNFFNQKQILDKEVYIEKISTNQEGLVSKEFYFDKDNTTLELNPKVFMKMSSDGITFFKGDGTQTIFVDYETSTIEARYFKVTSSSLKKENIKDADNTKSTRIISEIELKNFNYIGDKSILLGILADDQKNIDFGISNGSSVDLSQLVFHMLNEIKSLRSEVDSLKSTIKQK
jgi:hypothetical protein